MRTTNSTRNSTRNATGRHPVFAAATLGLVALLLPACGGGQSSAEGAGRGLVLLSFSADSVDNLVLNSRLYFEFSEAVDATTVTPASIQIREGPGFGRSIEGLFLSEGSTIIFEPRLAGLCDHSDSGLKPDTEYRVQVVGAPEEFALRNMSGQSLGSTVTYGFHTRSDQDPEKYADQIPGVGSVVLSTTPATGERAVAVAQGNEVVIQLSENVNPCTIVPSNVQFHIRAFGEQTMFNTSTPSGRPSGFYNAQADSTADQTPDHGTWGADNTTQLTQPLQIAASLKLVQGFSSSTLRIRPTFGQFPENALIVVSLTFEILDYGNLPMTPFSMSFTTENRTMQTSSYVVENEGETPYDKALSTADINTARSPGLVQGYMLFAGDGDNGNNQLEPTKPQDDVACSVDRQTNSGAKDNFDPSGTVVLDTGATVNLCKNSTDGSKAVVWEFATFRVRNGSTVRIIGVNPAIILVQGDVLIENGGRVLVRGDGQGGGPQGNGENGEDQYTKVRGAKGGTGVAGGGNGGTSTTVGKGESPWSYGEDGFSGVGSPDYDATMSPTGPGMGGAGGGGAGSPSGTAGAAYNPWDAGSAAGGGGGHSSAGIVGETKQGSIYIHQLTTRSFGGGTYGDPGDKLLTPFAGSGGGSAGAASMLTYTSSTSYGASGGGGGAGGGFLDLTSSGNIEVYGSIDATGGRGGNGDGYSAYGASAGGGGGSGGGVRLLTPNEIKFTTTTIVTTAGGAGGTGYPPYSNAAQLNNGGSGGVGRVALEDGDSVISGLAGAQIIPGEGTDGFYRGGFQATRFKGGGLEPQAISGIFPVGPFDPSYLNPVQNYGVQEDFIVGVPVGTSPAVGKTSILIEAKGFEMLFDGTADLTGVIAAPTAWHTVGYFTNSGIVELPAWHAAANPPLADIGGTLPPGNNGVAGIAKLNGREFIQLRITIYLPNTVGPFDAGSYLDRWMIRFTHDQ